MGLPTLGTVSSIAAATTVGSSTKSVVMTIGRSYTVCIAQSTAVTKTFTVADDGGANTWALAKQSTSSEQAVAWNTIAAASATVTVTVSIDAGTTSWRWLVIENLPFAGDTLSLDPTTGTAVNASGTSHNAAGATEFDPAANSYILANFCAGTGLVTSWAVETSPQTYALVSAVNTRMMVEGLANSGALTDEVPTATSVGSTATKCVSIAINSITPGGTAKRGGSTKRIPSRGMQVNCG